jgi:BolA family transcriptional regulator, general stress-responsive regulator
MTDRSERIRALLAAAFAPTELEVIDDSHHHAGHAGAAGGAGHFRVRLRSESLQGLTVLARHRRVYDALASMIPDDIHALSIDAQAPSGTPGHD